jgi:hypothetical protein
MPLLFLLLFSLLLLLLFSRRCRRNYGAPVGLWPYNLVDHNSKGNKMNPHRSENLKSHILKLLRAS